MNSANINVQKRRLSVSLLLNRAEYTQLQKFVHFVFSAKMSDEPGHKAMLYFLEILMNNTGPLTISQLAGRFGSSNFTLEMRTAAGGNESGLRQFLLKYPSLFTIRGNMVSLCDGKEDDDTLPDESSPGSLSISSTGSQDNGPPSASLTRRGLPDVSVEMEAVQYFRTQLARREERWVPVKSLAGHLSQTTPEIRGVVGPQLEFKRWLLRHVHIFDVQGDVVALCDGLPGVIPTAGGNNAGNGNSTPAVQRRITFDLPGSEHVTPAPSAPKTPPAQRRSFPSKPSSQSNSNSIHRSHSFSDGKNQVPVAPAPPQPTKRHEAPVTMTANEYKAVMFVKDVLERRGAMGLASLFAQATPSTDSVKVTLGTSVAELGAFLKRHPGIFEVDEELVALVKNAKLSVIITGSRPAPPPPASPAIVGRTLTGKGKIFHVAKLWGIVDLGEHEHVFFDRSIMRRPMDDLQRHFHTGEMLCFHAVMAHKTSRARWKAVNVWKENEQEPSPLLSSSMDENGDAFIRSSVSAPMLSQSEDIEDEINEFLPRCDRESVSSDSVAVFSDSELSGTGSVPIWNFRQDEERTGKASVTVVPETYQMSASALSDLRFAPDFIGSCRPTGADVVNGGKATKQKKFASVACQTVSTNDIIATQLYQDN